MVHPEAYVVAKLEGGPIRPRSDEGLFTVIVDGDGATLVCREGLEPLSAQVGDKWTWLEIPGPFGFDEVGVIARFSSTLAGAGIPLLSVSSFHRDHFLVKRTDLSGALEALQRAGFSLKS